MSSHTPKTCTSPEVGTLLPDYIVDLLDDEECEAVERHLNSCPRCKDHYLTVLRVRRQAAVRRAEMIVSGQNGMTTSQSAAAAAAGTQPLVQRKGKPSSDT